MSPPLSATHRSIQRIVRGRPTSDGAGVRLSRVIGSPDLDHLDPFLLLDEFGSERGADYIAGFPDHPHRGFETVTYMLAGRMEHRDHMGNHGELDAGSVQWMTAGRGIIHSEMPRQSDGLMRGFQLWVNLPAKDKMCEPRYQDIPPDAIPEVRLDGGGLVRIIAGEHGGERGAVSAIVTDPTYLDVHLPAGKGHEFQLPGDHQGLVYAYEGKGHFGEPATAVEKGQLGVLGAGESLRVTADNDELRFLLIAARPLREPIVRYGPFVMNSREQILEAVRDYQSGRFG
ncbi:MAG: pirin family protein [Myxococcales bacterium]|nr:pirin family protein [Myxococcales bacterium]